jgi:hypothetical protein
MRPKPEIRSFHGGTKPFEMKNKEKIQEAFLPGTDVKILRTFSPKYSAKKLAVFFC